MKIRKFNLFITSDINSPGRTITFSNIFIYVSIFSFAIIVFFSILGFYYLFFHNSNNDINSIALDSMSKKANEIEKVIDSFYQSPVRVTSDFDSPVISSIFKPGHKGIDITGPIGTKIYAVMPGKVFYQGNDQKMGNIIIITHDNGYITKYMHNKNNFVNVGDSILLNKAIAEMGKTGSVLSKTEGIHLHFELCKDGGPMDPLPFIKNIDLIDSQISELKNN